MNDLMGEQNLRLLKNIDSNANFTTKDIPVLVAEIKRLQYENMTLKANSMIQQGIIERTHNPLDREKIVRLTMENASLKEKLGVIN